MPLNFEWDPRRATANLKKHGASFEAGRSEIRTRNFLDTQGQSLGASGTTGGQGWVTSGERRKGRRS